MACLGAEEGQPEKLRRTGGGVWAFVGVEQGQLEE